MTRETVDTASETETYRFGESLAAGLVEGDVLLLHGTLGSGKTVLARGVCAGLGVDPREVRSPSFTLVNEYSGRLAVFHVDLYRCEAESDFDELGLEEIFRSRGVCIVEWAERLGAAAPAGAIVIHLEDLGGDHRRLTITRPEH